jgi:hypothetical protein
VLRAVSVLLANELCLEPSIRHAAKVRTGALAGGLATVCMCTCVCASLYLYVSVFVCVVCLFVCMYLSM